MWVLIVAVIVFVGVFLWKFLYEMDIRSRRGMDRVWSILWSVIVSTFAAMMVITMTFGCSSSIKKAHFKEENKTCEQFEGWMAGKEYEDNFYDGEKYTLEEVRFMAGSNIIIQPHTWEECTYPEYKK